ncbi:Uncharacterized membrane protein YfcC, ion transporter superfamily [Tindallia magadiensis]|uniref:Uncharacterized membrane protein YfcC, ion transporter superfamily n=1 Tax=Tindallia magadiensis TaxID=69895 RepID=A0A1I3BWP7_9FIRM|nr:AbgT family transporter [Tindallia magadiensis]SFH66643.1 Uncharacterized membrane protein YfcC, ion transporter superfamily [Tindallia magadiensis]
MLLQSKKKKEKRSFPHLFVILMSVIIVATVLTYVVPAGSYERVVDETTGQTIIDPLSFEYVEQTPVGPFAMLLSIQEGLIQAAPITFLVFMAFASLYLVQETGAVDASIALMVKKTKKNTKVSSITIALIIYVLAAWGSTGTISYEQIIAFIPIFCTLAIALGYDPLVGLGMSFLPVGMGFASSTVNPFTIGVAQGIAELPLFSGVAFRLMVLAVMSTLTVVYVLWYANRVKKDPSKSIVAGIDFGELEIDEARLSTEFTTARKMTLVTLLLGVGIMAYGLSTQGWYINEVAAIFVAVSIISGLINRWSPNRIAEVFVEGLSKGVLSALVVGVARGILVVISKGNILDTIIYSASSVLTNFGLYLSGIGMLIVQSLLNFLIPSGSGQAATSMPIMAPLADLIGMNRQISVLIFQFGDGFSNLIWPTSFILIACSLSKIPLNKYYKFVLPFLGIAFIFQILFIMLAININYGPF